MDTKFMGPLKYTIMGKPVTKKNSMRMVRNPKTGKMFPLPSKQYIEYEAKAKQYLDPKPLQPIDIPVNIKAVYFLNKNKDGSISKNLPDLTNLLEATDDLLVRYGIIKDDNVSIVAGHDGSRVRFIEGEPQTRITIEPIDGGFWIGELEHG